MLKKLLTKFSYKSPWKRTLAEGNIVDGDHPEIFPLNETFHGDLVVRDGRGVQQDTLPRPLLGCIGLNGGLDLFLTPVARRHRNFQVLDGRAFHVSVEPGKFKNYANFV